MSTLQKPNVIFMTDGAATIHCAGCRRACKIHILHFVAQTIRKCYTEVNELIANTKAAFLKSPKRIQEIQIVFRHL